MFLDRRRGAIVRRETAATIRGAAAFGGKRGVKVKVRRDEREGGAVPTSRFPVEPSIELRDETREGGVGLFRRGDAVRTGPAGSFAGLPAGIRARLNGSATWTNCIQCFPGRLSLNRPAPRFFSVDDIYPYPPETRLKISPQTLTPARIQPQNALSASS